MIRHFLKLNFLEKTIYLSLLLTLILLAVLRGNAMHTDTDFHVFWYAGKNFYAGYQLYLLPNINLQYLYPPFAASLFGIFALMPFKLAAITFSMFNVVLWFTCFYESKKIIERLLKVEISNTILLLTFLFTINFHIANLNLVQVNLVLYLFTLLFIKYYLENKFVMAGIFLAAAICFKVTPIIFLSWLFIRGNFRTFSYTLISIIVFLLFPLFIRGVKVGMNDLSLFYETMVNSISTGSPEAYSSSRSLGTAISNYFLTLNLGDNNYKEMAVKYLPVLLGFIYLIWLFVLRVRRVNYSFFEFAGTYLIIFLTSAVTADAHMVAISLPIMGLLSYATYLKNKVYQYMVIAICFAFILPIGKSISEFLLLRLCIYTLALLALYVVIIRESLQIKHTS